MGWIVQSTLVGILAVILSGVVLEDKTTRSIRSLAHLLYGALIPTLAMINFPQSLVLAGLTFVYLAPWGRLRGMTLAVFAFQWGFLLVDLKKDWEDVGNLAWVGVFAIWVPLSTIGMLVDFRGEKT
jgi:glycosylphosphatidylinositol transamidase